MGFQEEGEGGGLIRIVVIYKFTEDVKNVKNILIDSL